MPAAERKPFLLRIPPELWQELEATVFLVTHSVAEAVFLGDRIWIFTPGPGTIGHVVNEVPERRASAEETQRRPEIVEAVRLVGEAFHRVLVAAKDRPPAPGQDRPPVPGQARP